MTDARAGGLAREVLRANTGSLHAGGVAREVIRVSTGIVRVGGVVREVLVEDVNDQARIGGVVREALVTTGATSPATKVYVDGLVREALLFTVGPANSHSLWRSWLHHLCSDDDLADADWTFFIRRSTSPSVNPNLGPRRPWLRHAHCDDAEDDAPLLLPARQRFAAPIGPGPGLSLNETLFIANIGRLMGRGA